MTKKKQGRRVDDPAKNKKPGDYALIDDTDPQPHRKLIFLDPLGVYGCVSELDGFPLIEEDAGTITVGMPLLSNGGPDGWTGTLERGVWKTVDPQVFVELTKLQPIGGEIGA